MRVRHAMMAAGVAVVAWSAAAQAQQGCGTSTTADACQKTQDIFNFLTPQISTALAGGSTTLGQGGVLGGFGHFAVALRATAVRGAFPTVSNVGFSTTGVKPGAYEAKDQFVPMASIDGAIGIFKGFPLGVTRAGGVDVLLTATYLPTPSVTTGETQITLPGGNTKFGAGVRVGLLQESILVPGVSVSWVQRDLPTISVSGTSTVTASGAIAPGVFTLSDLSIKTSSWRLSASKTFLIFGLEGGFGQDKYENSAGMHVLLNPTLPAPAISFGPTTISNSMTRTNIYGGLTINFFIGKLVGEVGQASGGTLPTLTNAFGGSTDAAKSRGYFTVGLRTGF